MDKDTWNKGPVADYCPRCDMLVLEPVARIVLPDNAVIKASEDGKYTYKRTCSRCGGEVVNWMKQQPETKIEQHHVDVVN